MIREGRSLHRPAPRRSYRRFLIACAVMAMAMPLLPAVTEAQVCVTYADCACTPKSDSSVYPMAGDDGLGFATPQAECEYVRNLPFFVDPDEEIRAVGYVDADYQDNGCVRSRRSRNQRSLGRGWRAWGPPNDVSVSGPGAHVLMAWTKKDADGKTFALIELYASGIYRSSGVELLDVAEVDHITFCRIEGRSIAVPTQFPGGPACCRSPFPRTPGERCTEKPRRLPLRECPGPM